MLKKNYNAETIAEYVINKCIQDDCPISNLQLQNILYCIQRYFLDLDIILFLDDFEAWEFGPVLPDIFYKYCMFGARPIKPIKQIDSISLDKDYEDIINSIIERKRILKPWEIGSDIRRDNGAWSVIYNNGNGCHKVIPKKLIKDIG